MTLIAALLIAGACKPDAKAFTQARDAYYKGVEGDQAQVTQATKLFEGLHTDCPADSATLAYWGSLKLLEASHTFALWRKNSLSKQGLQALDQAVESAPDNLEIRFVRAATTFDLPGFFHRREQSRDDFTYLASRAEQAAHDGRLEPRLAAASLYYYGEFLHQDAHDKEAVQHWQKAIRLAPQSRAARQAANELKQMQ